MNVIISNKYRSLLETLDIDVIKRVDGVFDADELGKTFQNFFFQRMILDITALNNYKDIRTLQKLSIYFPVDKIILFLDDSPECSDPMYISRLISIGIYNYTQTIDGLMYLYNNPNEYRDVAQMHILDDTIITKEEKKPVSVAYDNAYNEQPTRKARIIGFDNLTQDAGSTTLIYALVSLLKKKYDVMGIEINRNDFIYFNDKSLISTTINDYNNVINKNSDKDIIFIDINDVEQVKSICTDIFYLIEPSIIKLNKMLIINNRIFSKHTDGKFILNKSLLNPKEVSRFEFEARIKVFANIPPFNDRNLSECLPLVQFINSLGYSLEE